MHPSIERTVHCMQLHTDIHIDEIFYSSRYVGNGIHIRFAFFWCCCWCSVFTCLRVLVFFSVREMFSFMWMWKICFYGASLSELVSTVAVDALFSLPLFLSPSHFPSLSRFKWTCINWLCYLLFSPSSYTNMYTYFYDFDHQKNALCLRLVQLIEIWQIILLDNRRLNWIHMWFTEYCCCCDVNDFCFFFCLSKIRSLVMSL